MKRYRKPVIRTYTTAEIQDAFGPAQMQYGTVDVHGGGSAMLNNKQPAEYRFADSRTEYNIITKKEVGHA